MSIGIITNVFNGYGRFVPTLCRSLVEIKPEQLTIVAHGDHRLDEEKCRNILGDIKLKVIYTEDVNHGRARNIAIENTKTEWIILVSADDEILPEIVEEIKKCEGDVLSIAYIERCGDKEGLRLPPSPTKRNILHPSFYCKKGMFLIPFSPFKRSVWEKVKYPEVEYPNAPFWIDLALNDIKISKTDVPCAIYNKRKDSHSNRITSQEKGRLARDIKNYKKEQRMPKLSIFTICKNEEEMIEDMFKSAQGADEHVVVDTGSTDKTIEIAKKYTDKIHTDYTWNDDFSEAKNYALSKCTGDWVMGLDADCRLEPGGIDKIREMIQDAEGDCLNVKLFANSMDSGKYHLLGKIFRGGRVQYYGKVHEYPTVDGKGVQGKGDGDVKIIYLYSPNHYKDPERNLRILLKSIKEEPQSPRWRFYIAREYFERKEYIKAVWWMNEFLKVGKWAPEIAEAYLVVAKSYWQLQMGNDARNMCIKAIQTNPEFKEAYRCMAEYHFEPWKSMWLRHEEVANNKGVLFVR